jgi:hypothetical protein
MSTRSVTSNEYHFLDSSDLPSARAYTERGEQKKKDDIKAATETAMVALKSQTAIFKANAPEEFSKGIDLLDSLACTRQCHRCGQTDMTEANKGSYQVCTKCEGVFCFDCCKYDEAVRTKIVSKGRRVFFTDTKAHSTDDMDPERFTCTVCHEYIDPRFTSLVPRSNKAFTYICDKAADVRQAFVEGSMLLEAQKPIDEAEEVVEGEKEVADEESEVIEVDDEAQPPADEDVQPPVDEATTRKKRGRKKAPKKVAQEAQAAGQTKRNSGWKLKEHFLNLAGGDEERASELIKQYRKDVRKQNKLKKEAEEMYPKSLQKIKSKKRLLAKKMAGIKAVMDYALSLPGSDPVMLNTLIDQAEKEVDEAMDEEDDLCGKELVDSDVEPTLQDLLPGEEDITESHLFGDLD